MIIEIINQDWDRILMILFVVSWCWVAVGVSIGLDFYHGVRKAKEMGEYISSEGYRRTVKKIRYYYSVMFFALLFDSFDVITPYFFPYPLGTIPFVSIFAAIALILTELKSVREKAEDKARRNLDESFGQMLEFMKKKEHIMDRLYEQYKQEKDKENEKNI